jgi:hypothetical protein
MYFFSSLFFCSTSRLCFYLWWASKTGIKERGFGCSVYPISETLGNYIHRIISRSPASHKIVFRFLGIIAGEETSLKRVRRGEVLSGLIMVYLRVSNVNAQGQMMSEAASIDVLHLLNCSIIDIDSLPDTQNNHLVAIAACHSCWFRVLFVVIFRESQMYRL